MKAKNAPRSPLDPTPDRVPRHRRGGQELPDNVQDRPEQNAGYDAVVHAGSEDSAASVDESGDDLGGVVPEPPEAPVGQASRLEAIDERAERDVIAEVRHRERRNP